MGLQNPKSSQTTFVSITNGDIVRRVKSPDGENVRTRKLTKGPNEGKEIHEQVYYALTGRIVSAKIEESDYGDQIVMLINDGIDEIQLTVGADNRYGQDIMMKFPNIDVDQDVFIKPFSFENPDNSDRMIVGVTIKQDDTKIPRYWTKDEPRDLPQPEQKKQGKKTVWDYSEMQTYLVEDFEARAKAITPPSKSMKDEIVAKSKAEEEEDDQLPF